MRLIRAVERLEEAGAAAARAPGPVGICWSTDEVLVDAGELLRGEYIATDVVLGEELDGARCVRIRERVTRDEQDLGLVRDAAGRVVGRVTEVDGPMLGYEVME